jgi:hypothetical protein
MDDEETMSEAADRAERLRAQRPIHDWVRRFRQVVREMPPEVWVFVAPDKPYVMALDPHGKRYVLAEDGMAPDAIIASCEGGLWDGGDW